MVDQKGGITFNGAMAVKILGLDPGSLKTGFGLIGFANSHILDLGAAKILEHGTLVLGTGAFATRLAKLGEHVAEILKRTQPTAAVVERIFLGKNADSAFKLGHARGVVLYEIQKARIPLFEYATREVKKGLTGNGNADKSSVFRVLESFYGLRESAGPDASDALALAVYHASEIQRSRVLSGLQESL